MNVLTALPWLKPLASLRPPTPATACPPREAMAGPGSDGGCGWFESSHDLARGLLVCEHASAAAVSGEAMAVADWLALQLAEPPLPACRAGAGRAAKASSGLWTGCRRLTNEGEMDGAAGGDGRAAAGRLRR